MQNEAAVREFLGEELYARVQAYAQATKASTTGAVRYAVREFLDTTGAVHMERIEQIPAEEIATMLSGEFSNVVCISDLHSGPSVEYLMKGGSN